MKKFLILLLLTPFTFAFAAESEQKPSPRFKDIVIDQSYDHTKFGIEPADLVYNFAAYTTSFDSDDDNNVDGVADLWGVPEWVAFEIKAETGRERSRYKRPSPWITDDDLYAKGWCPNDKTYAVSGTRDLGIVKGNYRYVRGHMCPKDAADRLSDDAGYNTHTTMNCVPQLQWQNNGIWKKLEQNCTAWADTYKSIWVVAGPVYFGKQPAVWLGQGEEVKAAVPDAIYKIVIRENPDSETGIETLAFMFPNVIPRDKKDIAEFLTSIEDVENVTGLTFLSKMESQQQTAEKSKHHKMKRADARAVVNQWVIQKPVE